jgi:hypothetical protein
MIHTSGSHACLETMPRVENMQPIMWEATRFASHRLRPLLEMNGLSASEDNEGNMWVGLLHEDTHEHNIWFFRIPSREFATATSWNDVDYHTLFGCEGYYAINYDFLEAIESIDSYLKDVLSSHGFGFPRAGREERARVRRNALGLIHHYSLGYFMPEEMAALAHLRWNDELHDLACHDVQAPEFVDMPRDLVLRAHGLKLIVEVEREDALVAARRNTVNAT